jgi:predicted metal-dependent peptidase
MTKHNLSPAIRIQKARTALLLDHPFFGLLLFRLGTRPTTSIETMATDGISLFYNGDFVDTLNAAELIGTLAHEVLHPALQHHTRRGGRNRKRWNMACDFAINPLLLDTGFTLPKDVLIDHRFRGMSAERIYNLIEEQGTAPSERSTSVEPSTKGGIEMSHRSQIKAGASPMHLLHQVALVRCLMLRSPQERTATAWLHRCGNGR